MDDLYVDKLIEDSDGGIQESFDTELLRSFDMAKEKVSEDLVDYSRVKIHKDKLRLSGDGIFYTLQGEGSSMGYPVMFLRLHICNLRCVWCDAYYTWDPRSKEFWTESFEKSIEETANELTEEWNSNCKNKDTRKRLVITGGEPLIQKRQIDYLMQKLDDWYIEIETNGTIMPTANQILNCRFNCSPKLENSDNSKSARIKPDVIKVLADSDTQFKFVAMNENDLNEIVRDYIKPFKISPEKILIMPQGVTTEEVNENAKRLVEDVKRHGFRMMTRLHVDLWGARRRV